MSDPRITEIRRSSTLNPGNLKLPFVFIQEQFDYSVESILRPIQTMQPVHLGTYPNTFPNTIQEYYWINTGSPGADLWMTVGVLSNGLYFFYTAQCPDTQKTFLDGGHMNLWVSVRYSDIINYAMDDVTYKTYIEETQENNLQNK